MTFWLSNALSTIFLCQKLVELRKIEYMRVLGFFCKKNPKSDQNRRHPLNGNLVINFPFHEYVPKFQNDFLPAYYWSIRVHQWLRGVLVSISGFFPGNRNLNILRFLPKSGITCKLHVISYKQEMSYKSGITYNLHVICVFIVFFIKS